MSSALEPQSVKAAIAIRLKTPSTPQAQALRRLFRRRKQFSSGLGFRADSRDSRDSNATPLLKEPWHSCQGQGRAPSFQEEELLGERVKAKGGPLQEAQAPPGGWSGRGQALKEPKKASQGGRGGGQRPPQRPLATAARSWRSSAPPAPGPLSALSSEPRCFGARRRTQTQKEVVRPSTHPLLYSLSKKEEETEGGGGGVKKRSFFFRS